MTALLGPRIIVPPGWARIPIGDDNARTARELFADAWRRDDRDSIGPHLRRIEAWLVETLDAAHDAHGICVVLPLGVPWEVPVSTAIVLSRVELAGDLPNPGDDGAELVDTDAGPARRTITDAVVPEGADPETLHLLRSIEYTWPLPAGGGVLIGAASISGQPVAEFAPVTDALTTLITTMLDALDWQEADR